MARVAAEGRLEELVEAAARLFRRRGYRRTQMADVARAAGVSPGTLYNYVEGKEALFDLCVERAFDPDTPAPTRLPVPLPGTDALFGRIRERMVRLGGRHPILRAAVGAPPPEDPAAEVATLVRELYDFLRRNWRALQLLERSATDWPALAEVYYGRGRGRLLDRWVAWIERRVREGVFREVPDPELAARLVLEACAWFAWHRHGDPATAPIDDDRACETIVLFTTRALLKEPPRA